ncbi:hypothetical protein [Brevibacillus brevis]|uniref:Spore protein n=1 Tax=Brevibacillus brevis TaxID=1393 RepID=A0ABY9T2T9_BREBE|nr:hypothetical protein [Brevibacillus brevis]WNC13242.1 hypothetical protein RGB73_21430 [Brevibacillus brevis]
MTKQKPQSPHSSEANERNRQPDSVKNNAPGFGDKKLEGPNRPST